MKKFLLFILIITLLIAAEERIIFNKASYYNNKFIGRTMANGELFSQHKLICASNNYKLGTKLKITNIKNDSSVIVIVSDRTAKGNNRIDLSKKAFSLLDNIKEGIINIKIEEL